ncbi:hypothetical protein [Piscinibacter sp. HJYY11]|uniref:hypothetical protein n=1 Tax=Piscinibacter sp. HJYY11 TaxID=2801333 RepID=UPI00191FF0BB|nr:hypothetical protein [Piscinibacter sp. HJYY11]MBL0726421.1 hypothetical protein [Piscinibacter sp. HJYY11]
MNPSFFQHRKPGSLDGLTSRDLASLLRTAESLRLAAEAGRPQQPLRGKNIAVMSESGDEQAVQGITAAASALGARVSHIRPGVPKDTAPLLGRLYDAIECEGLPDEMVRELERGAGRPVFCGLGVAAADLVAHGRRASTPVNHHYALQALLCSAVA